MTTERKPDPVAQAVATLIHAAGHREDPPPEAYGVVLAAAEEVFHRVVQRRRRWRIAAVLAATVVVAAAVAGLLVDRRQVGPSINVAQVERVTGETEVREPGERGWAPLKGAGSVLRAGARLRTGGNGAAAITLAGGTSLRLAPVTEVDLDDDARVNLRHGIVYADSDSRNGGAIRVVTPAGTASDFGTQFEVRYEREQLRIRVREGRVELQRDSGRFVADAGTQLAVNAAGDLSRTGIARTGPDWQWAEAIAPTPDFDDQPVDALLHWVARETGYSLRYASAGVAQQAERTILHGRIGQMPPLEALETLLQTTDLTYVLVDNATIEVRHR